MPTNKCSLYYKKKTIRLGRLFSQSYTSNVKFRLGLKVYSVNNIKVHSTFSSFVPSISMKTFTYVYESAEWNALNRTRKRFVSISQEKCCLDSQITEIKLEPTVITLCLYVSVCVCLHVCNVISLYVNLSFFIALFLSFSREFRNKKKECCITISDEIVLTYPRHKAFWFWNWNWKWPRVSWTKICITQNICFVIGNDIRLRFLIGESVVSYIWLLPLGLFDW